MTELDKFVDLLVNINKPQVVLWLYNYIQARGYSKPEALLCSLEIIDAQKAVIL